jgi:hypothetical protein
MAEGMKEEYERIEDLLDYADDGSDIDDGRDGYFRHEIRDSFVDPFGLKTYTYDAWFDRCDEEDDSYCQVQTWRVTVVETS